MFVPSGVLVTVPLTLMQTLTLHGIADAWPSASTVASLSALNVALTHSIYDYDRLRETDSREWGVYGASTRLACLAATTALAVHENTQCFAALVPLLHSEYSRIKPGLASVKPLFVSSLWGAASTLMPVYWTGIDVEFEPMLLLTALNILQVCASSNIADVKDIDKDFEDGIFTPAVLLGPSAAFDASLVIFGAACILRAVHPWTDYAFISYDVFVGIGIVAAKTNNDQEMEKTLLHQSDLDAVDRE